MSLVKPPIVVISGHSGSGKTTLCRMLASRLSFHFSVSCTTRAMRGHEKEGCDYYFVSRSAFEKMMGNGDFLEWAEVYGNFYGTPRRFIAENLKKKAGIVLDVDPNGALAVKREFPHALLVFVVTPSLEELDSRLKNRGTESRKIRQKRLKNVEEEEKYKKFYDVVLVNRNLEEAFNELKRQIDLKA